MARFTTNTSAALSAADELRNSLEQARREVSEIGLYIATDDVRSDLHSALERDIRSGLDALNALRKQLKR